MVWEKRRHTWEAVLDWATIKPAAAEPLQALCDMCYYTTQCCHWTATREQVPYWFPDHITQTWIMSFDTGLWLDDNTGGRLYIPALQTNTFFGFSNKWEGKCRSLAKVSESKSNLLWNCTIIFMGIKIIQMSSAVNWKTFTRIETNEF